MRPSRRIGRVLGLTICFLLLATLTSQFNPWVFQARRKLPARTQAFTTQALDSWKIERFELSKTQYRSREKRFLCTVLAEARGSGEIRAPFRAKKHSCGEEPHLKDCKAQISGKFLMEI